MNRIFHARIVWYQYLLLIVLAGNLIGFLWHQYIIPAVFIAIVLLIIIEQIIHTTYTLSADNILTVSRGRFTPKKVIPLAEIHAIRKCHSMRFGRFSITNYLLIEYGKNKFASVIPTTEREFVEIMQKRMEIKTT